MRDMKYRRRKKRGRENEEENEEARKRKDQIKGKRTIGLREEKL